MRFLFFFTIFCQCMLNSWVSDCRNAVPTIRRWCVHRIQTHSVHDVHTVCSQARTNVNACLWLKTRWLRSGLRSRSWTFLLLRLWKILRRWCELFLRSAFSKALWIQIVVVPVPHVVEEQLVAEETHQTSVEIRTEVEYVALAPAVLRRT